MQCAKRIPSRAPRALPVSTMQLPLLREAPLQILERPALMLLRKGSVRIHDRHAGSRLLPKGSIGFYPAQADYEGGKWSAGSDSLYSVLEMPEEICIDLLDHIPGWLEKLRRPLRFLDSRVMWWIDEIESHCAAGEPNGTLYTEVVGLALLTYLDSRLSAQSMHDIPLSESLSRQSVRRMKEHIDEHIAGSLSIQELAAACGYSPTHFTRVFKQSFGMPVHQFVMQRRIELARAMLNSDTCSLAEIAIGCGFSSQAHFNSAFKRYEGTTPGNFRASRAR